MSARDIGIRTDHLCRAENAKKQNGNYIKRSAKGWWMGP
jgi:hypothetical protein